MNRNYGYQFNSSEAGSSSDPCSEIYRGEKPFSELETQAVKKFIENHTEINIAYNYHTYGNIYITPFSYVGDVGNKILQQNLNYFFNLYQEFEQQEIFPKNNIFGNSIKTLKYTCDGEASDWMLAERRILAFSPELGSEAFASEAFYPSIAIALEVVKENLSAAIYGIQKSGYAFKLNGFRSFNNYNPYAFDIKNSNKNKSLVDSDFENKTIQNSFNADSLYYWAKCSEITNNGNFSLLIENEYNLIYENQKFLKYCDSDNNKADIGFYSISATIQNEGMAYFSDCPTIKFSMVSKGISRIIGSLVKYDYYNSSLIRIQGNIDSESIDYNESNDFPTEKIYLNKASNLSFADYNFTVNYLEPNTTLLLDVKLYFQENTKFEDTYLNLDLSMFYVVADKFHRKLNILNLAKKDFKYFNSEKHLFATGIFNADSYDLFEVLVDNEEVLNQKKKLWNIYYIMIPILSLIVSISLVIFLKKKIFRKKLNLDKIPINANPDAVKNKLTNQNIVDTDNCMINYIDKQLLSGNSFPSKHYKHISSELQINPFKTLSTNENNDYISKITNNNNSISYTNSSNTGKIFPNNMKVEIIHLDSSYKNA